MVADLSIRNRSGGHPAFRSTARRLTHPAVLLRKGAGERMAGDLCLFHSSKIATARVQPADAPLILKGKQETVKPVGGSTSRFASFSMWQ